MSQKASLIQLSNNQAARAYEHDGVLIPAAQVEELHILRELTLFGPGSGEWTNPYPFPLQIVQVNAILRNSTAPQTVVEPTRLTFSIYQEEPSLTYANGKMYKSSLCGLVIPVGARLRWDLEALGANEFVQIPGVVMKRCALLGISTWD